MSVMGANRGSKRQTQRAQQRASLLLPGARAVMAIDYPILLDDCAAAFELFTELEPIKRKPSLVARWLQGSVKGYDPAKWDE